MMACKIMLVRIHQKDYIPGVDAMLLAQFEQFKDSLAQASLLLEVVVIEDAWCARVSDDVGIALSQVV